MSDISVIVPTIWSFEPFSNYIQDVADLEDVKEIIIIDNNHARSKYIVHPKIKILVQAENIFVNPAWNLGAKCASGDILCILNDDIIIRNEVFSYVRNLLQSDREGEIGLIGLDWDNPIGDLKYEYFSEWDAIPPSFGCLMFIRRCDYKRIPNALSIWHGDHYLFLLTVLRKKRVITISGYADEPQCRSVSTCDLSNKIEHVVIRDSMMWNTYVNRWMRLRYRPIVTITDFLARLTRR